MYIFVCVFVSESESVCVWHYFDEDKLLRMNFSVNYDRGNEKTVQSLRKGPSIVQEDSKSQRERSVLTLMLMLTLLCYR